MQIELAQHIIQPRALEKGFHVVAGPYLILQDLQEALVLYLKEAKSILWIDSGNLFNLYQITQIALKYQLEPRAILKKIMIARPFTAFQFQQMLSKIPRTTHHIPFVVISDLMGLFYDSEIQESDLKRAYLHFKIKLEELKERALILAVLLNQTPPPGREHFLAPLLNLSTSYSGEEHGTNLTHTNSTFASRGRSLEILPSSTPQRRSGSV